MLKTILLLIAALFFLEGRCQKRYVKTLDSLSKAIAENLAATEGEQAFLTTNKSIYSPGETVWFRAFLLHSLSNRISTRSKTVFVDVVDEHDKRITTALLNAKNQQTSGSLSLPDSLPSGHYWVRAYTKTIAATDPEKAAVVPIYFFNPQTADTILDKVDARKDVPAPLIHLYAEGETLVTGASSTIALHIADREGRPVQINGWLKDSHGTVAEFYTNVQGLCKIPFSPSRYRRYWTEIRWKDSIIRSELPPFNFYAGQVAVSRNPYGDFVVRTMLEDSIYQKDAVTYLLGISRGRVCFAALGHGRYELEVPEQNFPKGIATFLLFDAAGQLLSERSVYVKNGPLNFQLNLNKTTYTKREKIGVNTTILDDKANALPSSLAVSVADNEALAFGANTNYRLVNSILSGHDDNWSLAHLNGLTDDEMDLVMLCIPDHFKRMAAAKPTDLPDETDSLLYIKGTLSNDKKPVSKKVITLFTATPLNFLMMDTTDASGRFSFPMEAYPDSTRFALQVGKANTWEKGLKLLVDSFRLPAFRTPPALKIPLDVEPPEVKSYFFHAADTTIRYAKKGLLKEVIVKTSKIPFEKQRVSFMSRIITSDALIERGRATLGDALLGRNDVTLLGSKYSILIIDGNVFPFDNDLNLGTAGAGGAAVSAVKNGGNRPGTGSGSSGSGGGGPSGSGGSGGTSTSDVLETLDFGPLYHFLNGLRISDIDFIEILSPMIALEYGPRGQYGGIYIHTKAADGIYPEGGLRMFYAKGYCKEADFPLVDYGNKAARNEQTTDWRSTLFWIGNVLNNAAGSYKEEFYTNDIPGAYTVTVSGITQYGDIIFDTSTFKIK